MTTTDPSDTHLAQSYSRILAAAVAIILAVDDAEYFPLPISVLEARDRLRNAIHWASGHPGLADGA